MAFFCFHLVSALRKISSTPCTVYRSVCDNVDRFEYAPGKKISWNAFVSTCSSLSSARDSVKGLDQCTLFHIKTTHGHNIQNMNLLEDDEVLLEPGTEFAVTRIENVLTADKIITNIHMDEVSVENVPFLDVENV